MKLGTLVCGVPAEACAASSTLDQLSASIDRFSDKTIDFLANSFDEDAKSFGAFCARVTLENAFAALVGRFDAFRMLYLAEFQAQSSYDYGNAAKSGFKWTGDVLIKDKPLSTLWHVDHEISRISRALFSDHMEVLFWKPAFIAAIDHINELNVDGFERLMAIEPDAFIPQARGECSSMYSQLSKGVHWEFFVSSVMMDEVSLREVMTKSLSVVSALAFVSHFVPTAYRALDRGAAVDAYLQFQGRV